MSRLFSSQKIIVILISNGFRFVSQKGSHVKYRKDEYTAIRLTTRGFQFIRHSGRLSPKEYQPKAPSGTLCLDQAHSASIHAAGIPPSAKRFYQYRALGTQSGPQALFHFSNDFVSPLYREACYTCHFQAIGEGGVSISVDRSGMLAPKPA